MNQVRIKQLKNRDGDVSTHRSFYVGRDASRMKFYDLEDHAQEDNMDHTPVMDNADAGRDDVKFNLDKFKDFK